MDTAAPISYDAWIAPGTSGDTWTTVDGGPMQRQPHMLQTLAVCEPVARSARDRRPVDRAELN